MRGLSLRLAIAIITFIIGVTAASMWFVRRYSAPMRVTTLIDEQDLVTQGRDLSLYDYGGRKGCAAHFVSDIPRCNAIRNQARAFIWKHWQERRRGYIIYELTFDDGSSEAHIFIEPDENGAWRIAWREGVFHVGSAGNVNNVPDIRLLEQRRAVTDESARNRDLGPVGTLILVLRDGDGKETGIF